MLSAVVLLGVVFFGQKARADVAIDTSALSNNTNYACDHFQQDWDYTCGIVFKPSSSYMLTDFYIKADGTCSGGTCTEPYLVTGKLYSLATSTSNLNTLLQTSSTTYVYSAMDNDATFTFNYPLNQDQWYFIGLFRSPDDVGSDNVFITVQGNTGKRVDLKGKTVEYDLDHNTLHDLSPLLTINSSDSLGFTNSSLLSFTNPTPNSKYNIDQLIPFNGTCDSTSTSTVNLLVRKDSDNTTDCGSQSCVYDDQVIEGIPCVWQGVPYAATSGTWNMGSLSFDSRGHYWLRLTQGALEASQYVNIDWSTYNDYASNTTSTTTCSIINWSCDFPLIGPVCSTLSTTFNWTACYAQNTINWNVEAIRSSEPFSYAFLMADAIYSGINNSTTPTSTSLNLSIPIFGQSTEIFNATSSVASIPSQTLSDLRPWFEKGIYILFGIYIIALIL